MRVWALPGQCATSDTLTDRIRGCMGVCVGVYVLMRVQPDTASHTLPVFSISYHLVEQLVTEEVGQTVRLAGSRMWDSQPSSNFNH